MTNYGDEEPSVVVDSEEERDRLLLLVFSRDVDGFFAIDGEDLRLDEDFDLLFFLDDEEIRVFKTSIICWLFSILSSCRFCLSFFPSKCRLLLSCLIS